MPPAPEVSGTPPSFGRRVADVPGRLDAVGEVFRSFLRQDSGCHAYGVEIDGARWFVKHAVTPGAVASLRRARAFHGAVHHPAIVPLAGTFETGHGPALVYPWTGGDLLYHPAERGADRGSVQSPHRRFRNLGPVPVRAALDAILDAHLAVSAAGFVAVDLYDGCFLYDFDSATMHLVDLDEYRPGSFRVDTDRLPGSTRFMAPEEYRRDAVIDERTTVFNLGRTIAVLTEDVAVPAAMAAVVERATTSDPDGRHPTVAELVASFRTAW